MAMNNILSYEQMNLLKPYLKKGEEIKELALLEFNGKIFKEIGLFKKRLLFGNETSGYIFIDSENEVVRSKNVLKELCKLAHFNEAFFSSEKGKGILASLGNKDDVKDSRLEMEDISLGLDFLRDDNVEGTEKIKYVVKKLPDLKETIDRKTESLAKVIDKYKNLPFNEEAFKDIFPVYENILRLNFENVKLMTTLADVCDSVQVAAEKKRKKWANRVKKNIVGRLMRVSDKIAYFKRVIRTYGDVINMSTQQYLKFLSDVNKEKIEARFNIVRN